MKQKNTSGIWVCSGLVCILLLLLFFSGCVQNSATTGPGSVPQSAGSPQAGTSSPENLQGSWDNKPINVTIHSTYKTMDVAGGTPQPGNIFVVIHMTIENIGSKDYSFNEKAVSITGGSPLSQEIYGKLTDPLFWGSIPPHQKSTGDVVFEVPDNTQSLALTFRYHNGQESFIQGLGTVPGRAGLPSPGITTGTLGGSQGSDNAKLLNVTIHSAFKTLDIRGSTSNSGNIFVVVNMTIENLGNMAYPFNENTIGITGGGPMTQKLYTQLRNPIHWGSIPPHERRTGEVVFGVIASTQQFTVTFLNNNNKVILTHEISNIPVVKDYSSSILPAGLLESKDFDYVVKNLDTPEKAAEYTKEKFTFLDRKTCVGQTAYQFFTETEGDCLSYANFFSYVLAQHGYDVKKVSFKYTDRRVRLGHVVTLFTESDGQLKYATTPDLRVFRNVSSVEDLIAQEQKRLGIVELDLKNGAPNFMTIPVEDTSSCH